MNKHPHLNNQDTHVYMWESPSRKRYVGVTNNIERRCAEYRRRANAGAQWPIHRAIRKYGDQMKLTVLFTETGEGARIRALDAEAFLVDFGDFDLNAAPGGQESPSTLPEVAQKIADATRVRMSTAEARERTATQSKARWATQEHRDKMKASFDRAKKQVRCNETGNVFESISDAARWLRLNGYPVAGVTPIKWAATGKRNYAYGHTWTLVNKE